MLTSSVPKFTEAIEAIRGSREGEIFVSGLKEVLSRKDKASRHMTQPEKFLHCNGERAMLEEIITSLERIK